MRKILVYSFIAAIVAISFFAGNWYQKKQIAANNTQANRKVLYYIDPMNPAHMSDKPGIAPCGMPLEPVYADGPAGGRSGASGMRPGTVNVSPEKQQLLGVKLEEVEKAPWRHSIRLLGRVVPDETRIYVINAATDGWVRNILPVTTGSLVAKDELMAAFFSPGFYSAVKAYLYGLNALDRFKSSETETEEQIDLTNANIDNYRNSLRNLGMTEHQMDDIMKTRKVPDNIEVRSPVAGFVIAKNLSLGQRFEKGTELCRIADLSRVWILADMFENEARYFRPGVTARVAVPHQNKLFDARVSNILPTFDAETRTMKVRMETNNPGFVLRPGMFVDAELPVTFPSAITVPMDAVIFSGTRKTLYVDAGDGFFEPRNVETGWRFGNRVEIISGLMEGERIVVSGNFLIDSESRIKAAAAGIYGASHKDPVCGMDVDEARAKAAGRISEHGGASYYFCSDKCKRKFDANPEGFAMKPEKKLARERRTPAGTVDDSTNH